MTIVFGPILLIFSFPNLKKAIIKSIENNLILY